MARMVMMVVALAACGGTDSKDGAEVFARICANCHGAEGKPPETMTARLGVRDLTSLEFGKRVTVELVEAQVRHGSKNQLMPAFEKALEPAQITAVATYVVQRFHVR